MGTGLNDLHNSDDQADELKRIVNEELARMMHKHGWIEQNGNIMRKAVENTDVLSKTFLSVPMILALLSFLMSLVFLNPQFYLAMKWYSNAESIMTPSIAWLNRMLILIGLILLIAAPVSVIWKDFKSYKERFVMTKEEAERKILSTLSAQSQNDDALAFLETINHFNR